MEATLRSLVALLRRLLRNSGLFVLQLVSRLFRLSRSKTKPRRSSRDDHDLKDIRTTIYPLPHEYPSVPLYDAASYLPQTATLQPYPLHANASRSSQEITTTALGINQDSYSLHSLSVQNLPGGVTLNVRAPPSRPPSSYLAASNLNSAHSSVVELQIGPPTESPSQSRNASVCDLDVEVVGGEAVASVPALLNDAHARIFPGSPDTLARYSRRIFALDERTNFKIPPLTIGGEFQNPDKEWKLCLHPEGTPYFFHAGNRVYTDANLFDPALRVWVNEQMRTILDFLRAHNVTLNANVDLILDEYIYDDGSQGCQYYFVNHDSRCLFWMDPADSEIFEQDDQLPNGINSAAHIGHILEERYWYHCGLFPLSLKVTKDIVDELRDIVLHSMADSLTSATSTVSRRVEELQHMVNVIDGVSKNVGTTNDRTLSGMSYIVGRFMQEFAHGRVHNFYGQPSARLDAYSSVYPTETYRTALIRILSPILFYAPDFHLDGLRKIYTDGLVRHRGWSDFVNRLTGEWQEFTLYATVVLNANVAFLSIQSVDTNGSQTPHRTSTQIASYMSMLTSIGAVIVGLLLLKQNRSRDRGTAPEASKYMFSRTHPTLGLETLAILYSLPYAMLIWSMVSFLAAFSFMCFENADLQTRTIVAVMWGTISVLILWCVVNGWENDFLPSWNLWSWWPSLFGRSAQQENSEDGESDAEKQSQKAEEKAEREADAASTVSKPKKRRWRWPSISLRKGSVDSDRTVV